MSRNHFQNILWNLHINDPDETNPLKGEANHDPLFLVRPMVDMMPTLGCIPKQPNSKDTMRDGCQHHRGLTPAMVKTPIRRTQMPATIPSAVLNTMAGKGTGQERNYLWMKACVLLRAESISSVTTPKSQRGSILNFLWSVKLALATFVALKFIQEMHLASHRVMHRKYRMHQKLHALS